MINPEHNHLGSPAPLLRPFALCLPVQEPQHRLLLALVLCCVTQPRKGWGGVSSGDMAWVSGSSAALPGPP